jgi:hypothetical protein
MIKQEFIKIHQPFSIDDVSNQLLFKCCSNPENKNEESFLFMNGKMYNHGFYRNDMNPDKIEHDWDILSSNKEMIDYIMSVLNSVDNISNFPCRPFLLNNFQYEKGYFLEEFFYQIGLSSNEKIRYPGSHMFPAVQLGSVYMNQSIFMTERPFENHYPGSFIEKYFQAARFMKIYLKNIKRISFRPSHDYKGFLPVFYIGETLKGSALLGLFTIELISDKNNFEEVNYSKEGLIK